MCEVLKYLMPDNENKRKKHGHKNSKVTKAYRVASSLIK